MLSATPTTWFKLRHFPWFTILPVFLIFVLLSFFGYWQFTQAQKFKQQSESLTAQSHLQAEESTIAQTMRLSLEEQAKQLQDNLKQASAEATLQESGQIRNLMDQFQDVQAKIERNKQAKLDTTSITQQTNEWGIHLLNRRYTELSAAFAEAVKTLDTQYQTYQAAQVKVTPAPTARPATQSTAPAANPPGYSSMSVSTSRGSFATKVIKLPLSQVNVRTVSASDGNCADTACSAKPLAQYVQEQGGFAGINGTYFCPPDYISRGICSHANSYTFAVYNSPTGNWVNNNALGWDALIGLAVFNGNTPSFHRHPNQWNRGAVTAGISNSPGLLVHQNALIVDEAKLDAGQKAKGVRGVLGVGGGHIYLAIISNASLMDAALVMQTMGASDALNLDGGGSAALYIDGSYKAGPGRLLPNAIVLTR